MALELDDQVLPFTGWESDSFVRFADKLMASGITPRVQVIGREPITTTSVDFEGDVVKTIWEGYSRKIVVTTDDRITYQVGGSNSTRPIASETVLFLQVPEEFLGEQYADDQLDDFLVLFRQQPSEALQVVEALKHNIRVGNFSGEARSRIVETLRQFLTIDDPQTKREIAEILGLIATTEVLEPLCVLLGDENPEVRVEVALRFRGLEPVVKSIGEDSELGTKCIDALVDVLDDPIDEVDEVRIYAAEDLGYFYNDRAVQALIRTLKADEHDHVRWAAIIAIGRTNKLDVAQYLVDALDTDPAFCVQQGAMLGLGRVGARVIRSDPQLIHRLIPLLDRNLSEGPLAVQDYAAYTIGELGERAVECVETLIEAIRPDEAVEVKSNAVLSLTKLLRYYHTNLDYRTRIREHLDANLSLSRPTGWPGSAFYNWFLAGAAELAALLEYHDLASSYYVRASEGFESVPWLSKYYKGIGRYEFAEHLSSTDDLIGAIANVDTAIDLFKEVKEFDDFQRESEKTHSGLQFKMTLAEARRNMLEAAMHWRVVALRTEDYEEIRRYFELALEQYRRIDVIRESKEGKRLSREEVNLVLGLRELAEIGRKMIELKLLSMELAEEKLALALGSVRADIRALKRLVENTRSLTLIESAENLAGLVERTYERDPQTYPITEVVDEFLNDAQPVYGKSLPTPGVCPVIDFGSASMSVELKGSISGDGSQAHPFFFPADTRLGFEFTVSVYKRTKNDQLILRGVHPPPGAREAFQEITVPESQYTLRPVDYGELAPSPVPTRFRFVLEFRNQGCSQPAQIMDVWVRVYDATREFTSPTEKQRERARSLRIQIGVLSENLSHLKESYPKTPPIGLKHRTRQLEIQIDTKKEKLAKLEESMMDL